MTAMAERRAFAVHPAILKTLINEQAGSLSKAMAELVMNAVDAGATAVHIEIDAEGHFVVKDDGCGFASRREIEEFFETFGKPHDDDDAFYGRFRIGRGQIMSYGATVWRSGNFEMTVDLNGADGFFGYDLQEHSDSVAGCTITGRLYAGLRGDSKWEVYRLCDQRELQEMVLFVPVPVFLNGTVVNKLPTDQAWSMEDEHAWYLFDREERELQVYNRGVFVCARDPRDFGVGGTVVSKVPLKVNLARNALIERECRAWASIRGAVWDYFSIKLGKVIKLTDNEASKLLRDLLSTETNLGYEVARHLKKLKFIPDIFGDLKTLEHIFGADRFTLFDGVNMVIAERVQREGLASVIMPTVLKQAGMEVNEKNAVALIARIRDRMHWDHRAAHFLTFAGLARDLADTSALVDDKDLSVEDKLVLDVLRDCNAELAWLVQGKRYVTRRLVAGKADRMEGWTDGKTFIALDLTQLSSIRRCGAAKIVSLVIHEYAHEEVSTGEHHHDHAFLSRYHEATMRAGFAAVIDTVFAKYILALAKDGIGTSTYTGRYLRRLMRDFARLPKRTRRNGSQDDDESRAEEHAP